MNIISEEQCRGILRGSGITDENIKRDVFWSEKLNIAYLLY